ncbi:cell wall-binding repeat-containing protein [Peribacillus frigoritolerans]|uniref:cell wall-binding repeat-containing protein n=1 Tax=Peribacillus frigoritolerans TaxID=450367 RepID=UPI002570BA04|nr:cell wall-binding repeat-containing protein [Peribacillus frigoritolerans]
MKVKLKRSLFLMFAFLLVFSNAALAAVPTPQKGNANTEVKKNAGKQSIKKSDADKQYKSTDKVRVIVEVEGEPAITYATKQGKKFDALAKSKQEELKANALKEQKAVKNQIASKNLGMKFEQEFTTVVNGFSGEVAYGKIALLEKLTGVNKVTIAHEYERPAAEPEMKYSKDLVEARESWDLGYDGEGMIVGIIDTGIDPSHRDMILSEDTVPALTEGSVGDAVSDFNLPGKYYTEKVPYGYNYMDENEEILDLGPGASMHGMHVGGTVGANGDEDNGGLKGVAPETQLLALKVFGNDPEMPSTWSDIYVKAIDDSIQLGADVLNMSLGSTASFVLPEDPEQKAIERAVENGVVMSVSAGNSAHLGNGWANPYASNPDVGVVGSPGLSYDSLQVASLENSTIDLDAMQVQVDGADFGEIGYQKQDGPKFLDKFKGQKLDIVYVGDGQPAGYEGKDVKGKVVFAVRTGGYFYANIQKTAEAQGAAGVIIRGLPAHGDYVSMALDKPQIPLVSLSIADGNALEAQAKEGKKLDVTFGDDKVAAPNAERGKMSAFTSWGVTPNLDFKPEITAPGGKILSTFNDNQYGIMSGTSMAAPHVAGGSAIVLERVDELFNLEGADRVLMAKNILMNTSQPVIDKGLVNNAFGWENPYSPRRQGAGLMKLYSALNTPAVVTESKTGEGKVALKEVGDKVEFSLDLKNFSDKAVSYDVKANVQTDFANGGSLGLNYDELEAQQLMDAVLKVDGKDTAKVEVAAGATKTVKITLDTTDAKVLGDDFETPVPVKDVFKNGYFVEGFVTFSAEGLSQLTVPYVGFNGDWGKAPILDAMNFDLENETFYGYSGVVSRAGEDYDYLGSDSFNEKVPFDARKVAISPNGDGSKDQLIPVLSFLRNAKEVKYNVLDENKNQLRTIRSEVEVRKHYYDGTYTPYTLNPANQWDGKVKNALVKDGQYYFEIAATVDYAGKAPQKVHVPVIVDTVQPTLNAAFKDNKVTFSAADERSGVAYFDVLVNGQSVLGKDKDGNPITLAPTTKEYKLENLATGSTVTVLTADNAGNTSAKEFKGVNDDTIPSIIAELPEALGTYDTNEVPVKGYVTDESKVTNFTVDGKSVELKWNAELKRYEFETTLTLEDGFHKIRIAGTDEAGNEISFLKQFFVDTTAPELSVKAPASVSAATEKATLTTNVSDNFDELRVVVDGDEVFYNMLREPYSMRGIKKEIKTEVALQPGENTFTVEAVDLAGHKTVKEVKVYRGDDKVSRISGKDRYATAAAISSEGWEKSEIVFLAKGHEFADALAGVPLAAQYDAPVLLTDSKGLSAATKAELERLGAETVVILGGTGAVSANVEKQLNDMGLETDRIFGKDRWATAAAIAEEVAPDGSEDAVVVNGTSFADALAVASYAGQYGMPIVLSEKDKLPAASSQVLKDLGVENTLVVGGQGALSDNVFKKLPGAERVYGKDRYATSVALADFFEPSLDVVYAATGQNFADALAGAALAAKHDSGVILVGKTLSAEVKNFFGSNEIGQVKVFGGKGAVSDEVLSEIHKLIE